jgi:hypothetical protein
MLGVSTSTIPSILSFATDLIGDFSPFIILILGIVIGFWVFELVIGWLRNAMEIKQAKALAFESGIAQSLKALKIKSPRFEAIQKIARKDPAVAKSIELHQKFKELMKE